MTLLYPTYLWSLLALVVPVGIHLWSKKEGKVIKVGSIEFLGVSDSKKSSSVRLNEIVLLMLRCLMVILLSVILAEPVQRSKRESKSLHFLVEPALAMDTKISDMIDTLSDKHPVSYLAVGFPPIAADTTNIDGTPGYWQLVRRMGELHADSIVVFSQAKLSGVKGKRPVSPENISWIVFEPDSNHMVVGATRKDRALQLKVANTTKDRLSFEEKKMPLNEMGDLQEKRMGDTLYVRFQDDHPWVAVDTLMPRRVLIAYETSFGDQMKLVRTSFQAIEKYLGRPVNVKTVQLTGDFALDTIPDLLVWLSNEPPGQRGRKNVIYQPDPLSDVIIKHATDPAVFYLTRKLNVEEAVKSHLTEHLLKALDFHAEALAKAEHMDARMVDARILEPEKGDKAGVVKYNVEDISWWFWLLLLAATTAERVLALYRKQ